MAAPRKVRGGVVGSIGALNRQLKGSASAGKVKLIPSDNPISVRFLTEPNEWASYYEHYNKQDGFFPCYDGDCCTNAESKASHRFLANCYVQDEQKVMAVKMPASLVKSLMVKFNKYSTMKDRWYELSRTGTGQFDTEYSFDAEPPERFKMPRNAQLIDLMALLNAMAQDDDEAVEDDDEDEEETPRRKPASRPKSTKRVIDDDDDFEDDDDDEDDEPVIRKASRRVAPTAKKRTVTKSTKTSAVKKPAPKRTVRRSR